MNIQNIKAILKQFMSLSREIQGVVLVSSEGQPLTEPMGIDLGSAMIISGMLLHLLQTTYQEFNWQETENITVQGQDSHVIFTSCYGEIFLLVKASKALSFGLLNRQINLTSKKLETEIKGTDNADLDNISFSDSTSRDLPQFNINNQSLKNSRIRYRGLRIN